MIKFLLSFAFIFSSAAFASKGKSCFQIDSGEEFCDLIFKGNTRQLWVDGTGDADHIKKIVSPYGVKPVYSKDGRAIATLAFLQYVASTVGQYNEFVVMYAVQRNDQKIGPISPLMYTLKNSVVQKDKNKPEYGYYVQKLVLGGEDKKSVHSAIEVGIKGYGFPKIEGEVRVNFEKPELTEASVISYDGSVKIEARMENSYFGVMGLLPIPTVVHSLTSGFGHPHWSRLVGFGWGGVAQSPKKLQLRIEGDQYLSALQFRPSTVLMTGRYRFELEGAK